MEPLQEHTRRCGKRKQDESDSGGKRQTEKVWIVAEEIRRAFKSWRDSMLVVNWMSWEVEDPWTEVQK